MSVLPPIECYQKFSKDLMGEVLDFIQTAAYEGKLKGYQSEMLLEMAIDLASKLDNAFEVRSFVDKKETKK